MPAPHSSTRFGGLPFDALASASCTTDSPPACDVASQLTQTSLANVHRSGPLELRSCVTAHTVWELARAVSKSVFPLHR